MKKHISILNPPIAPDISVEPFTYDETQAVATPKMIANAVNHLKPLITRILIAVSAQPPQNRAEEENLLTREELAEKLQVGPTTLDLMRKEEGFPELHLTDARGRGCVRFVYSDVLKYLRKKQELRLKMAA